jgi:wyosine [tRNA(Phe)-imidazoG37] synthetase (radical SAM superfamily)
MKYVFGPVPSRRLGQSLGIDPVPHKTCNWNCVYCQLGRSMPMTNERRVYISPEAILDEVTQALEGHSPGEIDWVTFLGSGEPTLHSGLGEMIREVKVQTSIPVAVITNGALLYLPEVRADLALADAVLPTLDAGDADLYRRINRPWPELTYERLVDGLITFRLEYAGKLWLEVMMVRGLNDGEAALRKIVSVLERIRPDQVHLSLPVRPPAESWVQPADAEGLLRAQAILGEVARVLSPAQGEFDLRGCADVNEAILSIITRHPMREDDLLVSLRRWPDENVAQVLKHLEESGQAQLVTRYGVRFWAASGTKYAN